MIHSYYAPGNGLYYQGREGYEYWIKGLKIDELWNSQSTEREIQYRLAVNDELLLNLADARRCSGVYLLESATLLNVEDRLILIDIANTYRSIGERVTKFHKKLVESKGKVIRYNRVLKTKINTSFRNGQIVMLQEIEKEENELVEKAKGLIKGIGVVKE